MDATTADLGMSRENFLERLAGSKLFTDAELTRIQNDFPGDAIQLSVQLVQQGLLTAFQLDAISDGRSHELRIGNYDLLDKLGAGGMGTVYRARHRRMKRIVALKVLMTALSQDESFVQRFQRETETIARLSHPNIVMAYDADEADIGHFLVMEFVKGHDLYHEVQKNGPMSVADAVNAILHAARGLDYAHEQKIIHRDIKPHNLMLDEHKVVKVMDLGLARLAPSGDTNATSGITQSGGILGTVDYMAPEQAVDSSTIDHRADIYSLGATLFFLLSGRAPYTGSSIMSILIKHREAAVPSLCAVREDVPPELDVVLQRMMAKSLDHRYRTMREVVQALEQMLGGQLPTASTPTAPVGMMSDGGSGGSSLAVKLHHQSTLTDIPKESTKLQILIVEPSRVQASIIRKYLEAQELVVSGTVNNGKEAIAAVRNQTPNAIVSALQLADMSGIELATQIRNEIRLNAPGFVLITSSDEGMNADSMSHLSRVLALQKPFSPEQLVKSISMVTGKSIQVKSGSGSVNLAGMSMVKSSGSAIKSTDRTPYRVLIVDDSAVARINEKNILQQLGFSQFLEAPDAAQAIAILAREPVHFIITDYHMPIMDGRAFITYLKQSPSLAKIPVVMVTTENDASLIESVCQLGAVAVMEKAFPIDKVRPYVEKLFG